MEMWLLRSHRTATFGTRPHSRRGLGLRPDQSRSRRVLHARVHRRDRRKSSHSLCGVRPPRPVWRSRRNRARAVDEARRRLELPEPMPRVNPPTSQLVGLPMWMWLEESWERIWATASIGDVWARVDAWPETSLWEFEDGTRLWCDQGVAYDMWRRPYEQSSGCTHTFTRSSMWSSGGVEWVRVTVTWGVEWTSSGLGGEPLGTVTRTAEFPVRVVEAQALVR